MPTTCKIHFENAEKSENIVHPGQKLNIIVRLKLTDEIKFRSINIHLRGKTHVCFMEDDFKRQGSYLANDNVLNMKKCLENGNGGEIQHLMPGTYDYSFQYILPHNLPPSYNGHWGYTKYTAQVNINIPCWPDKTFKQNFIVYKSVDLNDFPSLQTSMTLQDEISLPLFNRLIIYPGGPFNISARLDYGGYVPGQLINVEGEIVNHDIHHAILSFYVSLIRKTVYFKSENSKHHKTIYIVLDNKITSGCAQRQRRTFNLVLKVPKTPPSDTESKLIQISYQIQILGWMGSSQREHPQVFFPITIGTKRSAMNNPLEVKSSLPTEPSYVTRTSAPQQPDDDTVSNRTYTSTPPPFPDDEIDLPTYDEAMLLNLDDEFDINLEKIQYSFAQFYNQQGKSK